VSGRGPQSTILLVTPRDRAEARGLLYDPGVHRLARPLGAALVLGGLARFGCNPFPSYAGFAGGDDGGATVDATSGDGPAGDAGGDAGVSCPPQAIFCDDFERDTVMGSWTMENVSPGNMLSIAAGQPTGRVLAVSLGANSATMGSTAAALEDDPTSAQTQQPLVISQRASISSLLRIEANPNAVVNMCTLQFQYVDPEAGYVTSVVFAYFNGGPDLLLAEVRNPGSPGFAMSSTSIHVTTARWHQMSLSVDFTTSPATIALTLDPDAADAGLGGTIRYPSMVAVHAGTFTFQAGASSVSAPNGAIQMMLDDVVVEGS